MHIGITRRKLFFLATLCAVGPLSIDMFLPGGLAMVRALDGTEQDINRSVVSYLTGLIVGQLICGSLSDRYGRKSLLLTGFSIYTLGSIGCACATTVEMLLSMRIMQGMGGAAGMVIARAIIRDSTTTASAAQAYSLLMLIVSAAPLIAPTAGVALLAMGNWRTLFIVLAGFGAICLMAIWTMATDPERLHSVSDHNATTFRTVIASYVAILKDRRFVAYTMCSGLLQGGMYAYLAASAALVMGRYGLSASQYGVAFTLNSLGMIAAAQINIRLIKRVSLNRIIGASTFVAATAAFALLFMTHTKHPGAVLAAIFVFMSMIGFVAPNAAAIALGHQAGRTGAASGLMGTMLLTIGVAFGALVTWAQRITPDALFPVLLVAGGGAVIAHRAATHNQPR